MTGKIQLVLFGQTRRQGSTDCLYLHRDLRERVCPNNVIWDKTVICAFQRHPCVPTSSLRSDVIPASRRHPCVQTSSLRKQGSRRTHIFNHLDPRVREDDERKSNLYYSENSCAGMTVRRPDARFKVRHCSKTTE